MMAKCGNALRGRWENFWSAEQTSVVRLVDRDDILAKMIYALANPVKDQLVERAHHWPGASALRAVLADEPVTATLPRCFFLEEGPMPKVVSLRFARPPGFEELTHEEFAELVADRIATVERDAAEERRTTGRRILGRSAILRQSWRDRPQSHEPRRNLSPRVAARNKWSRIEALLRNKAFFEAYRVARGQLRQGYAQRAVPSRQLLAAPLRRRELRALSRG